MKGRYNRSRILPLALVFLVGLPPARAEEDPAQVPVVSNPYVEPIELTPELTAEIDGRLADFGWRRDVSRDLASGVVGLDDSPKSRSVVDKLLESPMIAGYLRWMLVQRKAGFALRDGDLREARRIWLLYRQNYPDEKERTDRILAILARNEGAAEVRNLGPAINSATDEYMPIPELSGRRLYFTNRDPAKPEQGEDIFTAEEVEPGRWRRAPVSKLNTTNSESPDGLSADGTRLYLFGNYPGSLGRGDIFFSQLTATGWSPVKPLPAPVNSPYFESDSFFTADGKAMLFASDRPGGPFPAAVKGKYHAGSWWGNTDLYVSFIQNDGSFTTPRNLGPFVNTPGAERTPFLHPDGKTLYFSSDGYDGFGDMDIYKSVRQDDSWQRWSKPEHIGKTVNGSGTDWGFRLTAASDRGYFSGALPGSLGGEDLYEVVPLPLAARPAEIVVALRGRVHDEEKKGLQARIECEDTAGEESPGRLLSRPGSGEYYITLAVGRSYICSARLDGYISASHTVDLRGTRRFREEELDFQLVSLQQAGDEQTEIVLNNVLFDPGSDRLQKSSYPELNRLARILKENPSLKIEVQGHTDSVGNDTFNLGLSQKRAEAVRDYLREQGLQPERMRAKGYGETKPIASNDTAAGRSRNRRVSFVIVK